MILDLHRQGLSVPDIARRAGLDRKTVCKYITRGLEPPAYKPRKRRALLIDGFAPYLRERLGSFVENLNSRLRTYSTLRRHLGSTYLELLRFFLNHRRLLRSRHAGRQSKSPRELLNGHAHPHWLTLLGLGELQPRRV